MAELTIPEAAARLGVSVDTVRRRIKDGSLPARTDERGRYMIRLDDDQEVADRIVEQLRAGRDAASVTPGNADVEAARLRVELDHARELLDAERRHADTLRGQLEAAQHAQQRDAEERAELRRLLGNAQLQLQALLPAPQEAPETATEAASGHSGTSAGESATAAGRRPRWAFWRR